MFERTIPSIQTEIRRYNFKLEELYKIFGYELKYNDPRFFEYNKEFRHIEINIRKMISALNDSRNFFYVITPKLFEEITLCDKYIQDKVKHLHYLILINKYETKYGKIPEYLRIERTLEQQVNMIKAVLDYRKSVRIDENDTKFIEIDLVISDPYFVADPDLYEETQKMLEAMWGESVQEADQQREMQVLAEEDPQQDPDKASTSSFSSM